MPARRSAAPLLLAILVGLLVAGPFAAIIITIGAQ